MRERMISTKATNIEWDVNDFEDLEYLPTEIEIPDGMTDEDEISDYISDKTGFCHNGYMLDNTDPIKKRIKEKIIMLLRHHDI